MPENLSKWTPFSGPKRSLFHAFALGAPLVLNRDHEAAPGRPRYLKRLPQRCTRASKGCGNAAPKRPKPGRYQQKGFCSDGIPTLQKPGRYHQKPSLQLRAHTRTKRNDFPVGLTPPTSDIRHMNIFRTPNNLEIIPKLSRQVPLRDTRNNPQTTQRGEVL